MESAAPEAECSSYPQPDGGKETHPAKKGEKDVNEEKLYGEDEDKEEETSNEQFVLPLLEDEDEDGHEISRDDYEDNDHENMFGNEQAGRSTVQEPAAGSDPYDHLDQFRQQWKEELHNKPNSRSQSPRMAKVKTEEEKQAEIEQTAKDIFKQGMDAEDNGSMSLAIYYYKKALHLVPDIEAKVSADFVKSSPRVRQESESSMEGSDVGESLAGELERLTMEEDEGICQMQYEQRMTHISCLPVELILQILRWVVSEHMDFRSLEMFSLACKGFYMCARDETIWKLACEKIWGSNLGSRKKYGYSYRRMLLERPHLLFDGCYISKVTYVRQGEQSVDQFYRPFHLVEYYRYVRFFPDGVALMYVSADEPIQSLPKLVNKQQSKIYSGMLRGHYKLLDNKVTLALTRVKTSDNSNHRYKRHRRQAEQNDYEMTYSVEFDVVSNKRRANTQLVWGSYSVRTVYRSTGQENINNFDLNRQSFPPLIFSRVKSYLSVSHEPLI